MIIRKIQKKIKIFTKANTYKKSRIFNQEGGDIKDLGIAHWVFH